MTWLLTILSSFLFNTSIALQSRDAASAPIDLSMRAGLLWYLVKRSVWLAGTVCLVAAAVLQTIALETVSVAVMQSVTAAGILVLPIYARLFLRQPVTRFDVVAIGSMVAAVCVASALVGEQQPQSRFVSWQLSLGCVAASAAVFWAARRARDGAYVAAASGMCFAAVTLLQKGLALEHGSTAAAAAVTAAFVVCALGGFVAEMSALQTVPMVRVAPIVLGVSTVVPVLLAPALFDEAWRYPVAVLASLGVVVSASTGIARRVHAGRPEPIVADP